MCLPPPSYSLHAPLIPRVWPAAIFHISASSSWENRRSAKWGGCCKLDSGLPIKTLGADETWSGG